MKAHNCKSCNSNDLSVLDSEYQGEWSEQIYKCNKCGYIGERFFDSVFHLSPLIYMTKIATNLNNYDKKIKEKTQKLQETRET